MGVCRILLGMCDVMKVELWYDPVRAEIRTRINDNWQDENDMYSFLYPVRHYPMQTWLWEAGSWSGLGRQLNDLARGEDVELIFHGRVLDYADLYDAVKSFSQIRTAFFDWNAIAEYKAKMENSLKTAQKLSFPTQKGQAALLKILKCDPSSIPWASIIREEQDWVLAEKSELPCVFLDEHYPISYETLHRLERLTQSLRRPVDAICCFFTNHESLTLLKNYAAQYPRMRFSFCLGKRSQGEDSLKEKYGIPYQMRLQLNMLNDISGRLGEFVQEVGKTKQRRSELEYKKVDRGLNRQEQMELAQLVEISSWLVHAQSQIEHIESAADLHIIDTLGKGSGK